jgi:hypothetical protein
MPLLTHDDLQVTERRVLLRRLPEPFNGLRIVQISDLHFYEYTDHAYYERVVETVNRLNPDVVVATGDIVHYGEKYLPLAASFLRRINAGEVKLAIGGNHDVHDGSNGENVAAMLTDSGYRFLRNEHYVLQRDGQRLWFAGLDDLWYGVPDIGKALADVPNDREPVVVLSHNPLMFDPLALGNHGPVDLVLAGHTHAGHVYIPVLGPIYRRVFRMKYRYGMFEKNGCQLHVTSGVGSAAFYLKKQRIGFPRFRFNTRPEVVVLTLSSQD